MEKAKYFAIVERFIEHFKIPNEGVIDKSPIEVYGNSGLTIILKPLIPAPLLQYRLIIHRRTTFDILKFPQFTNQLARLWTRQVTSIPGRHIVVVGQPGVYYEEPMKGLKQKYSFADKVDDFVNYLEVFIENMKVELDKQENFNVKNLTIRDPICVQYKVDNQNLNNKNKVASNLRRIRHCQKCKQAGHYTP
ncbi:9836_t:CDS:2 [Funneliformis geosporum]|uniref:14805_t:CDS:1 n=1 Tax=Funneliformis geosporum TaxID=1117311 RepID=A0A9W4SQQ9_9GLOM|nr:9836_t:CDS:2 [Funneliformis geosporum]CAI2177831.1 14805_t:CDS:2 [Funneliformis geosporum]